MFCNSRITVFNRWTLIFKVKFRRYSYITSCIYVRGMVSVFEISHLIVWQHWNSKYPLLLPGEHQNKAHRSKTAGILVLQSSCCITQRNFVSTRKITSLRGKIVLQVCKLANTKLLTYLVKCDVEIRNQNHVIFPGEHLYWSIPR